MGRAARLVLNDSGEATTGEAARQRPRLAL